MSLLIAWFALCMAADGWTTWQVLRFGGVELWPSTKWLIKQLGLYWALVVMKSVPVVAVLWAATRGMDWRLLLAMCAAYTGIVTWNYLQLQKHKR